MLFEPQKASRRTIDPPFGREYDQRVPRPISRGTVERRDDVLGPECFVAAGQKLCDFTESAPLIAAMCDDIRAARSRIWLECYIFLDDNSGQEVARALAERARSGVDVRILYDSVGSKSTSARFFEEMRWRASSRLSHVLGCPQAPFVAESFPHAKPEEPPKADGG